MNKSVFIYNDKKFTNPIKKIIAFNEIDFFKSLKEIDELKNDYILTGYISYAAKDCLLNKKIKSSHPLLYFEVHNDYENFKIEKAKEEAKLYIKENIAYEEYKKNIEKIKKYIKKGTTYEVNYTFSNDIFCDVDGYNLFLNLAKNQKTDYLAYINNEYDEILSFSPELFFSVQRNKITTKPMKGTVKRKGNDKKEIDFLKNDVKNLAENTMIVDLLRNDLSKIENSSNIKVEKLFEVETHKTLHQMTSTISAELENFSFEDIIKNIFPCGSITGAPKISTMEVIDEVENYKRNIYCGAIGIIKKYEANFSVPIRILERKKEEKTYKFCSGGAIVYKSTTKDEWEECKVKKLFLGNSIDFDLIETVLIKNNIPQYYFEHLKRLKLACDRFGYVFNNKLLTLGFQNNKIARIVLEKNGNFEIQYRDINPIKTNKIIISDEKTYSNNPFLYYKTTYKPYYSESLTKIQKDEIFDSVFFNKKEELTEGSRSNIVLKMADGLYTPPIHCGLLNGIYREKLLSEHKIKEKVLYKDDLLNAEKIYMINSVRGIIEVQL